MKEEEKNEIDLINTLIANTDKLVKEIRSNKDFGSEIKNILNNIFDFVDLKIASMPDIFIKDNEKVQKQNLVRSFGIMRRNVNSLEQNPYGFFFEWHNFTDQWENYYEFYKSADFEKVMYISLN